MIVLAEDPRKQSWGKGEVQLQSRVKAKGVGQHRVESDARPCSSGGLGSINKHRSPHRPLIREPAQLSRAAQSRLSGERALKLTCLASSLKAPCRSSLSCTSRLCLGPLQSHFWKPPHAGVWSRSICHPSVCKMQSSVIATRVGQVASEAMRPGWDHNIDQDGFSSMTVTEGTPRAAQATTYGGGTDRAWKAMSTTAEH